MKTMALNAEPCPNKKRKKSVGSVAEIETASETRTRDLSLSTTVSC